MSRKNRITLFVLGLALLTLILTISQTVTASSQTYEVIFTIPVGNDGIYYEGQDTSGALIWGPTALSVAPDGSFWIADGATKRLLHYSHKGEKLDSISLDKYNVRSVGDIESTATNLWLLDMAVVEPSLHRLSLEGELQASYVIPFGQGFEEALTGIALGGQGEVLLEGVDQAGEFVAQLVNAQGKFAPQYLTGYPHHGVVYNTKLPELNRGARSQGYVLIGEQPMEVSVLHTLAGLRILSVSADGDFYIIVDEAHGLTNGLDEIVRHYDVDGQLLGVARVPVKEQYISVMHTLAVDSNGTVYVLLTRHGNVEVARLKFFKELAPILSTQSTTEEPLAAIQNASDMENMSSCRSRNDMVSAAINYLYNIKYLNWNNINGSCSNRIKPHYLSGAGYYSSVPYDWGGFDTVGGFNNKMSSGYQAGDINTTGGDRTCSRGVDCSGYVSRAWGLTTRYSTWNISNISWQLASKTNLQKGDILNQTGVHTLLFRRFWGSSICGYESTINYDWDQVVYACYSWDYFDPYVPLRYNNACP